MRIGLLASEISRFLVMVRHRFKLLAKQLSFEDNVTMLKARKETRGRLAKIGNEKEAFDITSRLIDFR